MASIVIDENLTACRKCGSVIRYTEADVRFEDNKTYGYYYVECPKPHCCNTAEVALTVKGKVVQGSLAQEKKGSIRKKRRSDEEILVQTNKLARRLYGLMGYKVNKSFKFYVDNHRPLHPTEKLCWNLAREAQLVLTKTNVDDICYLFDEKQGSEA